MTINLSQTSLAAIDKIKKRYPDVKSSVMPILYIVQKELGCLDDAAILAVSEQVDLPPVHVRELVTFYTMYYSKAVGKYHFQVCRTLSCAVRGSKALCEILHEKLNLKPGEVSADGKWSYEQVECLGSCGTAPMCQINDTFFENLTPEILAQIVDRISSEQPDLSLSATSNKLGEGFKDFPKSKVI